MTTSNTLRLADELTMTLAGLDGLLMELGLSADENDRGDPRHVRAGLQLLASLAQKASKRVEHFGDPALTDALVPALDGIEGLLVLLSMGCEKHGDPAHLSPGLCLVAAQVRQVSETVQCYVAAGSMDTALQQALRIVADKERRIWNENDSDEGMVGEVG